MSPPDTNARPYHHGDLYEALVNAGLSILQEGEPDKFTLRECARRAGVSHAAPKNHFASIDELRAEIAARGFELMVAELAAAADGGSSQSADARLIAMGRAYVSFACANPAAYHMMFRAPQATARTPHYREASGAAWAQIEGAVAAVLGPGRIDSKERAAHAWALVHGFATLIIDGRLPPGVAGESVVAESLQTLPAALRGLGTP